MAEHDVNTINGILTAIAERSASERLKTLGYPCFTHKPHFPLLFAGGRHLFKCLLKEFFQFIRAYIILTEKVFAQERYILFGMETVLTGIQGRY